MFLPTDQFVEEKIAKSAATIALHNFHWQYSTLVLFNSLLCSIDFFLSSYQKNVIVSRGIYYPNFVKTTRQYILFGADVPEIVNMLIWMQKHQFDNTGKYIVICQSERHDECNEDDLVNILWNYKIINVVLINIQSELTLTGFTYNQPEDCKTIRPTTFKNWNSCLLEGHKHCQNMFPLKLKNLHGCPVIVSTFNQVPYMNISNGMLTGADGDLLRVITEAMNFSLVVMTPRIGVGWGKLEDNGTWSGSLADVYHGWANFSMTSASTTQSRFTNFQMSTDYSVVTAAWVTHPSDVEHSSLKLLRPLQPYVQIILGISFLTIVLLKPFLKTLSSKLELNLTFSYDIVFHSWELCMGLPVSSFPTNKALLCLAAFWVWYCFLIRTFYQVCLISSLQTDVYSPEFDTVEQAIESGYTFGGGLALRDFYIDDAIVFDGWKSVESIEVYPIMIKLSKGLKFVMAMNLETTKMFLSANPNKQLHILPQVIAKTPAVIFLKKYSPLVNSLNVVLSRLKESGITQKTYLDNTGKKVLKVPLDNKIPITMGHYTGCYVILLAGWILSLLCFIIEKLLIRKYG